MPDPLIDRFRDLCRFDKVGLAVSGGRDSVALMLLVARSRRELKPFPDVIVYSVDHGLRSESAEECTIVAGWAKACGFEHRTLLWSGSKPSSNLQAAARQARYRLLAEAARCDGVQALVTAHHLEDQAETFLIRLARGSSVRGLSSMAPETNINGTVVLRPLLDVPRGDLDKFLEETDHSWINDPSNSNVRFERVKIRAAKPALEAIGLTATRLSSTAGSMRRAHDALEFYLEQAFHEAVQVFPYGFVSVRWSTIVHEPEEIQLRLLDRLIEMISQNTYPPRLTALERLRARINIGCARHEERTGNGLATLAGCAFEWQGDLLWIYREAGRAGFPCDQVIDGKSLIWDKRFTVEACSEGSISGWVCALGSLENLDSVSEPVKSLSVLFSGDFPKRAVATVPAFVRDDKIVQIGGGFTALQLNHCDAVVIWPIHPNMRSLCE